MPMMMVNDIGDVTAQVVIKELLGLARVQYKMREICKTIAMPHLVADIRTATTYTGSEKVPELVEADIKSQAYTKTSFDLWKNVVHLAISAEAELKSDIDIMSLQIADAAKELARMENSQIATEFETDATSYDGDDWDGKTNGVSDHDPVADLLGASENIYVNGYHANRVAMNYQQYADLITNTHITSLLERGTIIKTARLPAIAGFPLLLDENISDNKCYILDTKAPAIILGEGPEMAVQYGKDSPKFFEGYAIAKFIEPSFVIANAARNIDCV